jgi:hypothetical protein
MINEEQLEKRQKKVIEIIKNYIKPDLLLKSWNIDGLMVTTYQNLIFYI